MKKKSLAYVLLLSFCLANSGCATYSASQLPDRSIYSYASRHEDKELIVVAENYYSREKSTTYFDTDLTQKFIVPIFLIVNNKSDKEYMINTDSFVLQASNIKSELKPMTSDDVAKKIQRGVFWRTLGWCMIVPIVTIPAAAIGSGIQTGNVNKQAKTDVSNKNLSVNCRIGPKDTTKGVVFFNVDGDRIKQLENPKIKAVFTSNDNEKKEVDIIL